MHVAMPLSLFCSEMFIPDGRISGALKGISSSHLLNLVTLETGHSIAYADIGLPPEK